MRFFDRFFRWVKRPQIYALVGGNGTGKSFRARLVAQKYGIDLIIDDGLVIRGDKILAGHSAKREKTFLAAVKTAVFDDKQHRDEAAKVLHQLSRKKVLILGTSDKMVNKIATRLQIPPPQKIIRIEDIATREEIETAIRSKDKDNKEFYIVDKRILPKSIQNVIKVNDLILKTKMSKYSAIKKVGISRSTYYKYKDFIKPFYEGGEDRIYSLHLSLKDRVGILSDVLDVIAREKISILTVVQNMAVDGVAKSTILIKLSESMQKKIDKIISKIGNVEGIADIRITGSN